MQNCLALGPGHFLNAVTPAEINAFKNSPFGRSLGDNAQHSWPGRFLFHFLHSTLRKTPYGIRWRIRGMRVVLVEQISSQFMMYFYDAQFGEELLKGLSCIVSSLDATDLLFYWK